MYSGSRVDNVCLTANAVAMCIFGSLGFILFHISRIFIFYMREHFDSSFEEQPVLEALLQGTGTGTSSDQRLLKMPNAEMVVVSLDTAS